MVTAALLALLVAAPPPLPPPARPPPRAAAAEAKRVGDWPRAPSGKTVTLDEHLTVDGALAEDRAPAG